MKPLHLVFFTALILTSCGDNKKETTNKNPEQTTMETKTQLSNKEKGAALLRSLETGDQKAASYINPESYTQHNLAVADGMAGFAEVLQNAPEGGFKANVIRSFEDGNYTFHHTVYDFFGPKVGFDIFRFEDGRIVEHWDNLAELAPVNPSKRTQTDGATEPTDLDKTNENKALVADFMDTILINGEFDKLPNYFDGDNYLQHNSMIADGLSGLSAGLEAMAQQGITMVYNTTHKVLGEGNFVLVVSEGSFAGEPTSFYDLFRIENGKIAEHWDILETILPEEQRKNSNGKFNF